MIVKRLDGCDRLVKIVEDSLEEHTLMGGSSLTLSPESCSYEMVLELYLKIIRVQAVLVEQFRRSKISEVEFLEKQEKIELRKIFLKNIEHQSLDKIRDLSLNGKFEPTNFVTANILAEGATINSAIGAKALSSLSGWATETEANPNITPSLTINLSSTPENIASGDIIDASFATNKPEENTDEDILLEK